MIEPSDWSVSIAVLSGRETIAF